MQQNYLSVLILERLRDLLQQQRSPTSITLFALAAGAIVAQDAITQILRDLNISVVDRNVLEQAIALNFRDFEDAVQYVCGVVYSVDAIVTRDASGFVGGEIPVMSPEEFDSIDT
jgi:hypothetical protein